MQDFNFHFVGGGRKSKRSSRRYIERDHSTQGDGEYKIFNEYFGTFHFLGIKKSTYLTVIGKVEGAR